MDFSDIKEFVLFLYNGFVNRCLKDRLVLMFCVIPAILLPLLAVMVLIGMVTFKAAEGVFLVYGCLALMANLFIFFPQAAADNLSETVAQRDKALRDEIKRDILEELRQNKETPPEHNPTH